MIDSSETRTASQSRRRPKGLSALKDRTAEAENPYSTDVHQVTIGERHFLIVGTAHISRQSAELVRKVIEQEKPDCVCVELDERRFKALSEKQKWESLDLRAVIRQKQLSTLLLNLLLSSYQKRLGEKLGVMPGVELLEATRTAQENNITIELCDRDIRTTLRRAWHSMSLLEKFKLLTSGLAGIFDHQEISEEKLAEIREQDVLSELMRDLGDAMPVLKTVLIDERDIYLTEKIRRAPGKRVVAVVGAGHVSGILDRMNNGPDTTDLKPIETIPPISPVFKIIGWTIPAIIISSILFIGWSQGAAEAERNALFWFLANGIPSGMGALVALAHPVTIAISFLAAPFTSLTPLIGAGYVAAFIQAYFQPPKVKDFQSVNQEVAQPKQWWKNRLLKIFLVFILTSLGSMIGTYVGGYEILTNLF